MMRKKLFRSVEGVACRVDFSTVEDHDEFLLVDGVSLSDDELRKDDVRLLRRGVWPGVCEGGRTGGCRVSWRSFHQPMVLR